MAAIVVNKNLTKDDKKKELEETVDNEEHVAKDLTGTFEGMVVGSTGTSVGTHLALEAIFSKSIETKFDNEREIKRVNIDDYKYHIWNIYTIVRNVIHAIPNKDKVAVIGDKNFGKLLAREVGNIASIYLFETECTPLLFFPDYGYIYKGMNMNKKDGFTKVYEEHMMVKDVLTKFKKSGILKSTNDGKGYKLPMLEGRILMTTNLAVDLCNRTRFDLLESHTGALKKKYEFNSKYHTIGENKLENIPFMEKLLYILGDKTIIKPMNITIRRSLVEVANAGKWTSRTTYEKVHYDIQKKAAPFLRDAINGYRSFY